MRTRSLPINLRAVTLGLAASVAACLSAYVLAATNNKFVDLLDVPARMTPLALKSTLFAVAKAGQGSVVAAGLRGHILRSADQGQTWVQRPVPLSSDLVSVQFPDAKHGWAVGHDGVVLASEDGGESWRRVMDGRSMPNLMIADYEKRIAAGETGLEPFLEEAKRMKADGPIRPFLSVYFRSPQEGWLMGQFNLLLHTADGGRSWQPWLERTENPDLLSLNSMAEVGGTLHIAAEAGTVLRLDATTGQFRKVPTNLRGSFFGITGNQRCVVVFGLQGTAARSCDGASEWTVIDLPTKAAINDGLVTQDGRLLLLSQQGQILAGKLEEGPLKPLPPTPGLAGVYGMTQVEPNWLVVVGERGPMRVALPSPTSP